MSSIAIRDVQLVNEGEIRQVNIEVREGIIWSVDPVHRRKVAERTLDGHGAYLLPGLVDDQVHFREPGLTAKGCIATESLAALRGGVTSYMEMPNTNPSTCDRKAWDWKMATAARDSAVNYSFYMGANGQNLEDLLAADYQRIPGVKIFMGSSTGELLVDHPEILREVYCKMHTTHPGVPISLHCENDQVIARSAKAYEEIKPRSAWTASDHPRIRNHEGCYVSSRLARELAEACQADIHILHLTTQEEVADIKEYKNRTTVGASGFRPITTEACVHHLWFDENDYERLGNRIKWNPAIKSAADRQALLEAVRDGWIDVVATDHAPHTVEEKNRPYPEAPSGGPLLQHSLLMMWDLAMAGHFTPERVVQSMCHAPSLRFGVQNRGFVREGYAADLVLLQNLPVTVREEDLVYRCGWSPVTGHTFSHSVQGVILNGQIALYENKILEFGGAKALAFAR
ncbi:MAG: dihydroorotase [Bacteroidota bacterium]